MNANWKGNCPWDCQGKCLGQINRVQNVPGKCLGDCNGIVLENVQGKRPAGNVRVNVQEETSMVNDQGEMYRGNVQDKRPGGKCLEGNVRVNVHGEMSRVNDEGEMSTVNIHGKHPRGYVHGKRPGGNDQREMSRETSRVNVRGKWKRPGRHASFTRQFF